MFSISNLIRGHDKSPSKKAKFTDEKPVVFVRLNTSLGKVRPKTLRVLLDSGSSGTLIAAEHVSKLRVKKDTKGQTAWSTPGGQLMTKSKTFGPSTSIQIPNQKKTDQSLYSERARTPKDFPRCVLKSRGEVTGTVRPPFGHLMSEAGRTNRRSRMVSSVTLWCPR